MTKKEIFVELVKTYGLASKGDSIGFDHGGHTKIVTAKMILEAVAFSYDSVEEADLPDDPDDLWQDAYMFCEYIWRQFSGSKPSWLKWKPFPDLNPK